jgi:serine phosphatase RsbU (regulator of sigma subunit)
MKNAAELLKAYKELAFQHEEKEKRASELALANQELAFQNEEKEKRASELMMANRELAFQNEEKEKRAAELVLANKELAFQNAEKEKRASELMLANRKLAFQNEEKEKRAAELALANKELAFQNEEKEKRASELIFANRELAFQNEEKEKRASELILANQELAFQNKEKEKRASELIHANRELAFQNQEKEKRAAELVLANKELAFQNAEKEKRASELNLANVELAFQNDEKGKRAAELMIADKELAYQKGEKRKRAAELKIADKELAYQTREKKKRAEELVIANIKKSEAEKYRILIEEKNKNITDSIHYAKRIQLAKLPTKESVYRALPQSFIYFKPKDIVSGDFYFFHQIDGMIFIAAADCTGHGVPGALMSMICSDKLADAVSKTQNISEIFNLLNQGIKKALNQTESYDSPRDGMDIALCSINTVYNTVQYAGANIAMWILRKNKMDVEVFEPTKKAIGGLTDDNQHFDCHQLKLYQGDTFYIFTDGYADTFGGANEKKMTRKRFRQMLLEIQHKTMMQQEEHLDQYLEAWKSGIGQVDDILVIGVRF